MSVIHVPFGFSALNTNLSAEFLAAAKKYVLLSTDATPVYINDIVKLVNNEDNSNTAAVTKITSPSDYYVGVVVAFEGDTTFETTTYRKANIEKDVYVLTDPNIVYKAYVNAALSSTDVAKYINVGIDGGNTVTGISSLYLDYATINTVKGQFLITKIDEVVNTDDETYSIVECVMQKHEYNKSQIEASNEYIELIDTPNSYTNAKAIASVNNSASGMKETDVALDDTVDGAITVSRLSGTPASLDITGTAKIDQDLTISSTTAQFADVHVTDKLTVDGLIDPTALILSGQTSAPSTDNGTIYYDSTSKSFQFREDGNWSKLGDVDEANIIYRRSNGSDSDTGLSIERAVQNFSTAFTKAAVSPPSVVMDLSNSTTDFGQVIPNDTDLYIPNSTINAGIIVKIDNTTDTKITCRRTNGEFSLQNPTTSSVTETTYFTVSEIIKCDSTIINNVINNNRKMVINCGGISLLNRNLGLIGYANSSTTANAKEDVESNIKAFSPTTGSTTMVVNAGRYFNGNIDAEASTYVTVVCYERTGGTNTGAGTIDVIETKYTYLPNESCIIEGGGEIDPLDSRNYILNRTIAQFIDPSSAAGRIILVIPEQAPKTPDYIDTYASSTVYIKNDGTVVERPALINFFDQEFKNTYCRVLILRHTFPVVPPRNLSRVSYFPYPFGKTRDTDASYYLACLGHQLLTTNSITYNGANLFINAGQREIISPTATNYETDPLTSANLVLLATTAPYVARISLYGSSTANQNQTVSQDVLNKSPTYGVYNDITQPSGSELLPLPSNKPVIINRFFQAPQQQGANPLDPTIIMQYGQQPYANIDEAIAAYVSGADSFIEGDFTHNQNFPLLGAVAVRRNATDLSNPDEAIFLSGTKLKNVGAYGGSGAVIAGESSLKNTIFVDQSYGNDIYSGLTSSRPKQTLAAAYSAAKTAFGTPSATNITQVIGFGVNDFAISSAFTADADYVNVICPSSSIHPTIAGQSAIIVSSDNNYFEFDDVYSSQIADTFKKITTTGVTTLNVRKIRNSSSSINSILVSSGTIEGDVGYCTRVQANIQATSRLAIDRLDGNLALNSGSGGQLIIGRVMSSSYTITNDGNTNILRLDRFFTDRFDAGAANYNPGLFTNNRDLTANNTAASRTFTIPLADIQSGTTYQTRKFTITDEYGYADINPLIINCQSGILINGKSSIEIRAKYGSVTLSSNGTAVFIESESVAENVVNYTGSSTYNLSVFQTKFLLKNTGAPQAVTFRLPVATSADKIGLEYNFYCDSSSYNLNIITYVGNGDYIYDVGVQKSTIYSITQGSYLSVKCVGINTYIVTNKLGTWV